MDSISAILVIALLTPIATQLGIDPVHIGQNA